MKKLILLIGAVLIMGFSSTAKSQVSINVNINSQPAWGPEGYQRANFYYFPDLNVYYNVNQSLFYYLSNARWISNRYLPSRYGKYDLYTLYKVVINNLSRPWLRNNIHQREYRRYRGNRNQLCIRSSNNNRYVQSKRNERMWVKEMKSGSHQNDGQYMKNGRGNSHSYNQYKNRGQENKQRNREWKKDKREH